MPAKPKGQKGLAGETRTQKTNEIGIKGTEKGRRDLLSSLYARADGRCVCIRFECSRACFCPQNLLLSSRTQQKPTRYIAAQKKTIFWICVYTIVRLAGLCCGKKKINYFFVIYFQNM